MSSFFPVPTLAPSTPIRAHGYGTKVKRKHPWKTMKTRAMKRKGSKAPRTITARRAKGAADMFSQPYGGDEF